MSSYSSFNTLTYPNSKIREKVFILKSGLSSAAPTYYLNNRIVKNNTTLLRSQYPELFAQTGHETSANSALTSRTSGTSTIINSITFGNGLYVYGGGAGTLRTSTDAITWTARTSGTTSSINTLVFGNNLYVYGTSGGAISTSTDAITWTARTSGTTSAISTILYNSGLYVYVANGGVLRTSTDAITWTARTSGTTSAITSLVYGNGLYVYGTNGGGISTSTDAVTWTARTSNTTSNIAAIVYGKGYFVAAGANASIFRGSTDGIFWATISTGVSATRIPYVLLYANNRYHLFSSESVYRISRDGYSSWDVNKSGGGGGIRCALFNNGLYVLGGTGGALFTSTDLMVSAAASTDVYLGTYTSNSIQFGNTIDSSRSNITGYVRCLDSPNVSGKPDYPTGSLIYNFAGSSVPPQGFIETEKIYNQAEYTALYNQIGLLDAYSWTSRAAITSNNLRASTYNSNTYLLGGLNGTIIRSVDGGVTWTSQASGVGNHLNCLAYYNGLYLYSTDGGAIGTSTDAITWTARTSNTSQNLYSISWDGLRYIVNGNALISSADGIDWTVHHRGLGYGFEGSTYVTNLGLHVAVGYQGTIVTSSNNGGTWIARTSNTTQRLNSVASNSSIIVVVGYGGTVLTSTDAITWTIRTSNTANNLSGVAWNGTYFVAVGASGTILTSTDAITWTVATSGTTELLEVQASSTTTVIFGYSYVILKSLNTDCTTWAAPTSPPTGTPGTGFFSSAYSPSLNMFVGFDSNGVWRSTDEGATWTSSASIGQKFAAIWTGSYFAAMASGLHKSTDGVTWTASGQTVNQCAAISYSNNILFAFPSGGVGIYKSTDEGVTWISNLITGQVTSVFNQGSTFIFTKNYSLVSSEQLFVGSNPYGDGAVDRTVIFGSYSPKWNGVAYGNGIYVLCGSESSLGYGVVATSTNTINWTVLDPGNLSALSGITYGDRFVVVGSSNSIKTSTNGTTWEFSYPPTSSAVNTVTFGNGVYVYGGNSGVVGTSTNPNTLYSSNYDVSTHFFVPSFKVLDGSSNFHRIWIKT